jgi:hypothetical protein
MSTVDSVLGSLLGIPAFPDARCRDRHDLYDAAAQADPDDEAECLLLCAGCGHQADCHAWAQSLRAAQRPEGVCAGVVWHRPEPRQRKPRKTSQEVKSQAACGRGGGNARCSL